MSENDRRVVGIQTLRLKHLPPNTSMEIVIDVINALGIQISSNMYGEFSSGAQQFIGKYYNLLEGESAGGKRKQLPTDEGP